MALNIFKRKPKANLPLFDEAFLRRMERLSFRTAPMLRGTMMGERRSRNLRPTLDFSDHRPYAPGDDLRHVDWHAYARHEDLFVKLGDAMQRVDIHVLIDCSRSMAWEPSQPYTKATSTAAMRRSTTSKWDMARRLAGALGYLGLAGGERVEIAAFGETLGQSFGPTQGKRRIIAVLKFLSDLVPEFVVKTDLRSGQGLAQSLKAYARTHPNGGLLIIISDMLDVAGGDEIGVEVEALSQGLLHLPPPRWQVLVLHLLTEEEMQPTLEGDYDLEDVETKEILPFHLDSSTLAQYRLRIRRWCAALQSACAHRGATYSRVLAEWPLEQKVMPYLRQRGWLE